MTEPVRDSRGVEIAEGARVRDRDGDEGVVPFVQPDKAGELPVLYDNLGWVVIPEPWESLTVIPDTVEVTVELPRAQFDSMKERVQRFPMQAEDSYGYAEGFAGVARLMAAVRDHPGSQEGEGE